MNMRKYANCPLMPVLACVYDYVKSKCITTECEVRVLKELKVMYVSERSQRKSVCRINESLSVLASTPKLK